MFAAAVITTHGVDQREHREQRIGQQHQCTQTIEHEDDAKRRLPVAQRIELDLPAGRLLQ
ncbi:hypothetical protein D3C81_1893230 [compost metagenome]